MEKAKEYIEKIKGYACELGYTRLVITAEEAMTACKIAVLEERISQEKRRLREMQNDSSSVEEFGEQDQLVFELESELKKLMRDGTD